MANSESRRHCIECNGYIRQQDFYDKTEHTRSSNCGKCESENWQWTFKIWDKAVGLR